MDALVKAAQDKVNETVELAARGGYSSTSKKVHVARAINAVDALKSALKAL